MTAALEGGEWSAARPGRTLPPGKTRYPFYRRLGGPQGRSRHAENLVLNGIRSPDRPARSQSLYRLSYRAHENPFISARNRTKKPQAPSSERYHNIGHSRTVTNATRPITFPTGIIRAVPSTVQTYRRFSQAFLSCFSTHK